MEVHARRRRASLSGKLVNKLELELSSLHLDAELPDRDRARKAGPARLVAVLAKLPGWVIGDYASVREEVAEWKGLSPLECWRLAYLCARDAMWAAGISGNRQRILDRVDPLPESTVIALARLRQQRKEQRGER